MSASLADQAIASAALNVVPKTMKSAVSALIEPMSDSVKIILFVAANDSTRIEIPAKSISTNIRELKSHKACARSVEWNVHYMLQRPPRVTALPKIVKRLLNCRFRCVVVIDISKPLFMLGLSLL